MPRTPSFPITGCPPSTGLRRWPWPGTKSPDTPFIFVTNARGEELAIDSLRSGATDYVLKERLDGSGPRRWSGP